MATVLRWNPLKTRKPHKCKLCGRMIPPGSIMMSAAWADGGTVFSEKFCIPCERYWREELGGEEISFDHDTPIYGNDFDTWDAIRKEEERVNPND